jgi:hypothetical protein
MPALLICLQLMLSWPSPNQADVDVHAYGFQPLLLSNRQGILLAVTSGLF